MTRAAQAGGDPLKSTWSDPPFLTASAGAFLFTLLAALGDWKRVNEAYGALPKAFSIGVIACAVLCFCVKPDFARAKKAASYLPVFFLLLAVCFLASTAAWLHDLSIFGSLRRGAEKFGFQAISIFYAVSMVYLFGKTAVDHFFRAIVAANTAIILLEIPRFGLVESLRSVFDGIRTYGEAHGFMRALELHDLTFLFGQFLIYYLLFAPREDEESRKKNRIYALVSFLFVALGLKRLVLPAIALALVFAWFLRARKKVHGWLAVLGTLGVVLSFVYIYLIYCGWLVPFLLSKGVNLMGRDVYWTAASRSFEFSPFWRGLGFESVSTLVQGWVQEGIIHRANPLHNDFLKVYIELGAPGLALWGAVQYVYYPQYWARRHFTGCAVLYMTLIFYMSVTYLTDNTAFYYWSSIGLRLIPMAYSYTWLQKEDRSVWRAPDTQSITAAVLETEHRPGVGR